MGIFDFLHKNKANKINDFLSRGAIILDVRTQREYKSGAIKESKHIPLQVLQDHVQELRKMDKPFVVCCASGIRSAKASKFLSLNNVEAINGGGWQSLQSIIDKIAST